MDESSDQGVEIEEDGVTRRGHDDDLLGFRDGIVMNPHSDTAAGAGDPTESVELAA